MATNSANIVLPHEFDATKLEFGAVRPLDNAGKTVAILYDGKPLYIQTPSLFCPFGARPWDAPIVAPANSTTTLGKTSPVPTKTPDASSSSSRLVLELALANKVDVNGSTTHIAALVEAVVRIDRAALHAALENSVAWFQKKHKSLDVVDALFSPSIRYSKDKVTGENSDKYPPNFRVSVYPESCKVFDDATHAPIAFDAILNKTKFAHIKCIVACHTVWVSGGKFGLSWRAVQMVVVPQAANLLDAFAFCPVDAVENNDEWTNSQEFMKGMMTTLD